MASVGFVDMEAAITEQEYLSILDKPEMIYQMAVAKAEEMGYAAEGYGVYNHKLEVDGNKYYVIWQRWHSCD